MEYLVGYCQNRVKWILSDAELRHTLSFVEPIWSTVDLDIVLSSFSVDLVITQRKYCLHVAWSQWFPHTGTPSTLVTQFPSLSAKAALSLQSARSLNCRSCLIPVGTHENHLNTTLLRWKPLIQKYANYKLTFKIWRNWTKWEVFYLWRPSWVSLLSLQSAFFLWWMLSQEPWCEEKPFLGATRLRLSDSQTGKLIKKWPTTSKRPVLLWWSILWLKSGSHTACSCNAWDPADSERTGRHPSLPGRFPGKFCWSQCDFHRCRTPPFVYVSSDLHHFSPLSFHCICPSHRRLLSLQMPSLEEKKKTYRSLVTKKKSNVYSSKIKILPPQARITSLSNIKYHPKHIML